MTKALIYAINALIFLAVITTEPGLAWHGCQGGHGIPACEYYWSVNNSITYDIKPSTCVCQLETRWDEWDEQELPNGTLTINIRCPGNATRITVGSIDSNHPSKLERVRELVLENCLIYWNDLLKIMNNFPIHKLILENYMDEFVTGETEYFYRCLRTLSTSAIFGLSPVFDIHVSSSVVRRVSKVFTMGNFLQWPEAAQASFSG